MAKLTIPDEETIATFPVTTANDTFPFAFAIFSKADLRLRVDAAVELDQADFTLLGTLLDSGGYQGGTIVLNTPVANCTLRIWRDVQPARPENFGAVTSVPVGAVDLALSRQMAVSQDLKRDQEVLVEALPYLSELPETLDQVFVARDEAIAAAAAVPGLQAEVDANAVEADKIPLIGTFQPSKATYHRKRALVISDIGTYEDDQQAPNDAAWAEVLSDSTDQYASGEVAVVDTFRLSGAVVGGQKVGFIAPQDTKIVSGDNMDASLNASRLWSGKKAAMIFANDVTQGVIASEGSKLTGLNLLKDCVATPPTSISDYFARLQLMLGDGLTANSLPGFEGKDLTIVGFARTGIVLGCERHNLSGIKADGLAGFEVLSTFDVSYLKMLSQWPLFGVGWLRAYLGSPGSPGYAARRRLYDMCLVRPGTALKIAPVGGIGTGTGADGEVLDGFQCFGYNTKGLHAVDTNACFFRDMWPDHVFSLQSSAAQAAAFAALTGPQQATVKANTLAAALTDAAGGTSGFNYAQYNIHPLYGTIQALGIVTEGDCQNTQISDSHVDSHAKNYALLHGGGQIGPLISNITSGQARLAQLEIGDNRGTVTGFQYAGGSDDAAIIVGASVEDWALSSINGDEVGSTASIRYGSAVTARNVKIAFPWRHGGVIQATDVEAYIGNVSPTTGSFQPVIYSTEVRDRLGEHNTSTGVWTAKYPGVVTVAARSVFAPTVATAGVHILRVYQNSNPIEDFSINSSSTRQHDMGGTIDVLVNPGDTITEGVFHEVGALWSGAQSRLKIRYKEAA